MGNLLRKHFYLILSSVLFIISTVLWVGYDTEGIPYRDKKEINTISNRIEFLSTSLDKQAHQVASIILSSNRLSFSRFNQTVEYPFFVFASGKVIYWSDYRFVPQYDDIKGDYQLKFFSFNNGKYLIQKQIVTKGSESYEVFVLLPLFYQYPIKNNYITSGLNKDIFHNSNVRISSVSLGPDSEVRTKNNQYLFSLDFSSHNNDSSNEVKLWTIICLFLAAVLLLVYYFISVLDNLGKNSSVDLSLLILTMVLVALRAVMLLFNFPFGLIEFELFDPKNFASSFVSPSLGDLFFNIVCITLFTWYAYKSYFRLDFVRWLITVRKGIRPKIISVVMITLAYLSVYLVYYQLYVVYSNSQWVIDITESINFDIMKVFCVIIFVLHCFCFFIWSHMFYRIYLELNPKASNERLMLFVISCIVCFCFSWLMGTWNIFVFGCFILYSIIVVNFNLPNILSKLKYDTYLYFLSSSLICALLGIYSLYDFYEKRNILNKEKFASQLFVDNDLYGEYLLSGVSRQIVHDEFIRNTLVNPFASKSLISQKIKKVYFPIYFDKYDLNIQVFDAMGDPFDKEFSGAVTYNSVSDFYKRKEYQTEYSNVYFIKESQRNAFKKYVVFNEVIKNDDTLGYVFIELKHKRIVPNNVYPELLLDRQFAQPAQSKSYNYAIFSSDKLLYNFGNYNYDKRFKLEWLNDSNIYTQGIIDRGFHHLAVKAKDDKIIVISSERYSFNSLLSNFSFLFLILIFFVAIFLTYAVYFRLDNINFTYATKIQIYLNVSFFIPLIIVSIATLSIISNTYKENLNKSFIKKAENLSINLGSYLEEENKLPSNKGKMDEAILEMAKYTQSDINIFDNNGVLNLTSQPAIYDNSLLSRYINPLAYEAIVENRSNSIMLNESVGKLNYNCAYVAVRSYQSGNMMGIISLPFFESKAEMDRQIIEVLTTILNIFTSTFIVFLVLSYFVSRMLTVPLKIITQKIRKTTLGDNEPIDWKSNDEIGMLVGEYNNMLVKLEQSRDALSKSEKESAWREMAKQVAHEIKNPLTPMKLTIQHLQRSIKEKKENNELLTDKTLNTLLDQVNTLNEIATSFSAFAKMPIPKNERFDVGRVLSSTVNLYNNQQGTVVSIQIEEDEVFVIGDEQLMGGILTNLILNGIQSVPSDREPVIEVKLTSEDEKVLIEVKDNGSGIPAGIRDKVFLPNFSTKYSGSGIGLAVAKRGVEHAGGKIWFNTTENNGTSFFIELLRLS